MYIASSTRIVEVKNKAGIESVVVALPYDYSYQPSQSKYHLGDVITREHNTCRDTLVFPQDRNNHT
jgi:RNase H-fold protein (predicted Holliday junction resolvase)